MDREDFIGLYESYMDVYNADGCIEEDVEDIDEDYVPWSGKPSIKASGKRDDLLYKIHPAWGGDTSQQTSDRVTRITHGIAMGRAREKFERSKKKPKTLNASYDYDLYDLVLEYLLDEGLCESVENAEVMMAHMSEGWVESIVVEATKTVMSVSSPEGKQRRLNTTRASSPARNMGNTDRPNAYRDARSKEQGREASSFTPSAESKARKRNQEQISGDRQGYTNMRAKYVTRGLQRKYGIPDSALDPKERSQGIPIRSVDLR